MQTLTNIPDSRSDCLSQAGASSAISAETSGFTKPLAIMAITAVLALLLTGCATPDSVEAISKEEQRSTALQRWNRCISEYTNTESASVQAMSIDESMEYCQGYRYDFLSTYPPHFSGSINRMLTDAAYRSGYRTLVKQNVDPELGQLLPGDSSVHSTRRILDLVVKKAIR